MTAFTLRLVDSGAYFRTTGAGPHTLTVPANAGVAIPVQTHFRGRLCSAAALTFVEDTGVTVNVRSGGTLVVAGKGVEWELIKVDTDEWDLLVEALPGGAVVAIMMPLVIGTSPPTLVAAADGRLIPMVWE